MGLVALLVLGALAPVAPVFDFKLTCGGTAEPPAINGAQLEELIAGELTRRGHDVTASCPKDRPLKTGDTFTCFATTADGTALAITVIQQDDQGNVTWLPDGVLVDTRELIAELKPKLPASATIACPKRTLQLAQEGDTASCDVRDGDQLAQLVIRFADAETGRVTFNLTQPAP